MQCVSTYITQDLYKLCLHVFKVEQPVYCTMVIPNDTAYHQCIHVLFTAHKIPGSMFKAKKGLRLLVAITGTICNIPIFLYLDSPPLAKTFKEM